MADDSKKTVYSYNWGLWCRIKFTRRSIFETFLFVKFVDLLEKNCVSYPEHSFPFPYDGRYSSNVKRSLRWSAWLSWINQRLEWTIGILKFFCFHHARKSKQTGKKNAAHTHNANADVGRLNHTLHYLFHHSPWFSPCFRRFFFKLLLSFNGFLFSFSLIVFFCLGFLRPFNYFFHVRFRCFLFVFLVTPFGVRVCYVEYIVFYRLAIDCSLSRRSLLFTTLSAVHIYDFHIVTVIYSPLHGLSGTKIPYRPEFCFCLCCWQKFCMQIIFGFKAEVCNLTMVFVLVICLLNW